MKTQMKTRMKTFVMSVPLAILLASSLHAERPAYPPIREYLMTPEAEISLARSAAPEQVSGRATIKLLTPSGFKVATAGDNGFTCLVLRGWSAPTFTPADFRALVYDAKVRAPICYDPVASRTVLPLQELRTQLAMQGKDPDEIAQEVTKAYALGRIPKMEGVSFAYMWSADMFLASGIGAFHPHIMVFAPYYDNAMLGANPFGGMAPFLSDDAGTPFAVVVIPVHGNEAIHAKTVPAGRP